MTRYLVALAIALILNATANLLIKIGMNPIAARGGVLRDGPVAGLITVLTNPTLIVAMVCFAANLLAYMYAVQRLPISVAYPIMVTVGFAIIVVAAGILLGERLTALQWVGVVMILGGVWLVASQLPGGAPA